MPTTSREKARSSREVAQRGSPVAFAREGTHAEGGVISSRDLGEVPGQACNSSPAQAVHRDAAHRQRNLRRRPSPPASTTASFTRVLRDGRRADRGEAFTPLRDLRRRPLGHSLARRDDADLRQGRAVVGAAAHHRAHRADVGGDSDAARRCGRRLVLDVEGGGDHEGHPRVLGRIGLDQISSSRCSTARPKPPASRAATPSRASPPCRPAGARARERQEAAAAAFAEPIGATLGGSSASLLGGGLGASTRSLGGLGMSSRTLRRRRRRRRRRAARAVPGRRRRRRRRAAGAPADAAARAAAQDAPRARRAQPDERARAHPAAAAADDAAGAAAVAARARARVT